MKIQGANLSNRKTCKVEKNQATRSHLERGLRGSGVDTNDRKTEEDPLPGVSRDHSSACKLPMSTLDR